MRQSYIAAVYHRQEGVVANLFFFQIASIIPYIVIYQKKHDVFFLGPAGKIISMTNPAHGGKCERETVSDSY